MAPTTTTVSPTNTDTYLEVLGAVVATAVARSGTDTCGSCGRGVWRIGLRLSAVLTTAVLAEPDDLIELPDSPLGLSSEMAARLTSRVNLVGIEEAAASRVLLHAAGLATVDGMVLGLIAPSGSGKTTAAITLARRGFGYVTDETLAIGVDLSVLSWPKPLALVTDDGASKELIGPDALGLAPCPSGVLRLGGLVVLSRDTDRTAPPRLRPLTLPEALTVLVGQSSSLHRLPESLRRLELLHEAVGGIQILEYAEIADAVGLLAAYLSATSALAGSAVADALDTTATRYVAAEAIDALNHGEGSVELNRAGTRAMGEHPESGAFDRPGDCRPGRRGGADRFR